MPLHKDKAVKNKTLEKRQNRPHTLTLERLLILFAFAHSVGTGLFLICFPELSAKIATFHLNSDPFFIRQGGVFHIILGFVYFYEHWKYNGITLIVTAKTSALVFLLSTYLFSPCPLFILFMAVFDALIGLAVWALHRANQREAPLSAS